MARLIWVARDKNGAIHWSNCKPMKPSEWQPNNPNANDECFWIPPDAPLDTFFMEYPEDIPELTFENSPKRVKLILTD